MKRLSLLISLLLMLILGSCHNHASKNKLIIATAANMQFAIKPIIKAFSGQTGISCHSIIGSSGKLTAQINRGAPYNIFVSADMKYPEEIYRHGLSLSTPVAYAAGKLVLWSDEKQIQPDLQSLVNKKIKFIAIANPKTAPYGRAAKEVLKSKKLWKRLQPKMVFGESIAQVNQFILSHAANIGFTAKSVVLSPGMKHRGQWSSIPDSLYSPIFQGVVVIKQSPEIDKKAMEFYRFLFSQKAKDILQQYGFQTERL